MMDDGPDNRELAKRFELLKKDFETMQANVNSTLNEMRANVNSTLNEMRADMAARETRMIVTISAIVIGGGGLEVAFLALLIGLPG